MDTARGRSSVRHDPKGIDAQADSPDKGWRARIAILALGSFAVGTDGYVIVGLLPQIAGTLHVGIAASGQLVSVFALVYALMAPVLAALTGRWSRRRVLVTALALLGAGNAVTALAGDYALVLASRVVAGCGAALFSASAVATASHLAPQRRRGSAIAMVTTGATLALVLGAPMGTVIGDAWGWQSAIWFITVLAAVVAAAIAVLLPDIRLDPAATLRQRLAPLTDMRVLRVLVVTLLGFVAIFLPFTYMSAVFAPAIDGRESRLALLLMVFGIAATVGNLTAGRLADRYRPRFVVVGALAGIAVVFAIMPLVRDSFVLAVAVQALAGLVCFSVIGPQQHRIIAHAPAGGAPVVTSLNLSTAYLGNFCAGALGAVLLSSGAAYVPAVAAAFALVAGLVAAWGRDRR
ncbi:MFS transporter [Nocardia panacis]|uniref:MFS transporter n=1 Tax=Nocardia panacis TaxID=2340916 RepID=A0A3A4KCS4_9NOCA|nr:MFS transporter [Nocardia panacis]RJO78078.1 MFS transporter [Nocardia panacis]